MTRVLFLLLAASCLSAQGASNDSGKRALYIAEDLFGEKCVDLVPQADGTQVNVFCCPASFVAVGVSSIGDLVCLEL